MKVKEIMTVDPAFCTDTMSLNEVAKLMADVDCGCVPVVDNNESKKPIGVITDRDITLRAVAHNKNPLEMIVGEVMSDGAVTVKPEMSIEECCELMERNQIRRVPVVGDNGALIGMVALADVALRAPEHHAGVLVKDVSAAAPGMARSSGGQGSH